MSLFGWKWNLEARLGLAWGLITIWTIFVAGSLLWNFHEARETALELARTEARLTYEKDLAYRLWAASNGGVYVPATPQTPPSPYLSHLKERDILTPSGRVLTLVNPAYMTRQVHELAATLYGARGHLTSLNPIRPENSPDIWEEKAMKSFEAGVPEVIEVVTLGGEPHMRLMRPWRTERDCLKCHAAQGYKEGDIRGGISVGVPLKPYLAAVKTQTFPLAASHGLIWILGLAGIILRERHIRRHLEERRQTEEALRRAYDGKEQLVRKRTEELRLTVAQLQEEIADRQQAENEIQKMNEGLEQRVKERTAQLESANKEMEAFSYSVSHDLKAPLRAIQGFSRILMEEHSARLDAEGLRLLSVIISNTNLMAHLIDDLLALSRLGRHAIGKGSVNLTATVRQISEQIKSHEPERDLQFMINDLPPAQGDRFLLSQVMQNLLDNAVKYTKPKKSALIEVGGKDEENETIYYVKDNGAGFDESYAHKLFGVFQRLHGGGEYEGTGVGLAIVKRIVERHGGRVWAEGKVNEGATFYFALPKNGGQG